MGCLEQPKIANINIYAILGYSLDPLYQKLNSLKKHKEIEIDNFKVRLTEKFLEVESDDLHECFSSVMSCYYFLDLHLKVNEI